MRPARFTGPTAGDDHGQKATGVILQVGEDDGAVLAGYRHLMDTFFTSNPGAPRSRWQTTSLSQTAPTTRWTKSAAGYSTDRATA
jgi:hypothetical protein